MATRNSNRNESSRNRSDSKPYKVVYGIVQREGMEKSFWTRIGAAWENRDGSVNVKLDFLPASMETTLQIRDPRPSEDSDE
jgi:hypothetical protein